MSADGVMGYGGTGRKPDFRREHLVYADVPLGFHKNSLTLGRTNLSYDLLKTFLWPNSQKKRFLITGNSNWFTRAFCYPYVDCSLVEWDWDRTDPLRTEIYTRTMSYHKIAGFEEVLHLGREAETDPAAVRLHFYRGLLWAIYPVGFHKFDISSGDGAHNAYRHLYRRFEPIIEKLSASGWEPQTYASSKSEHILVERYGWYKKGTLHFAIRNISDIERPVKISIDAAALDISPDKLLYARELTCRQPVSLKYSNSLFLAG